MYIDGHQFHDDIVSPFLSSVSVPLLSSLKTWCSAGVAMPAGARVVLESPGSSEMNEEDESPEMDLDYLDEYDSEEERKQKKKKKVSISCMCILCAQVAQCVFPLSILDEFQSSEAGHDLHVQEL